MQRHLPTDRNNLELDAIDDIKTIGTVLYTLAREHLPDSEPQYNHSLLSFTAGLKMMTSAIRRSVWPAWRA